MTVWQRASDPELISAVRGGDLAAWSVLCDRHLDSARRLARELDVAEDAEELVARVAERVLEELLDGTGPDVALRAHLLARVRSEQRSSAGPLHVVPPPGGEDPSREPAETRLAARAYRTLPERSQLALWHVEVEDDEPAQVASLLGVRARSVPSIARRARVGLSAAVLRLHDHEAPEPAPDCGWVQDLLRAYLRDATTRREAARISTHLQGCPPCRSVHAELAAVDDDLGGILGALVLGPAAAGYVAPRRTRSTVRRRSAAALAGVAAAAMLVTGVSLGLQGQSDEPPPTAEAPVVEAPVVEPPGEGSGPAVDGGTIEPSAPASSGGAPPATSDETTTAPAPAPTSPAPSSPPPRSTDGPSDDGSQDSPDADFSDPPDAPSPSKPTPSEVQPVEADPRVSASLPRMTGPISKIEVRVDDASGTDGRLYITASDPSVELFLDRRCTPLAPTGSWVCDVSEDDSPIELYADLRRAVGNTIVEFTITPRSGIERPGQQGNNHVVVPVPPPSVD